MTGFVKKEYVESDGVKLLQQALQNQSGSKPGDYVSQHQGQLTTLWGRIQNREPFRYDLGSDALYGQYRDQYMRQGQKAMMDTMGQAAALTGGYGNSYAQSVGQQTYGEYLQGLQSRIPEFYAMALDRYKTEGDQMLDQYAMLQQMEQQDYGRYRDQVADWNEEMERMYQQYIQERSYDYGRWNDEQNFAYAQYRDGVADDQWNQSFRYQQSQNELAYNQWLQEFEYQKQQDELAYQQWQQEFLENQRRYNQEWNAAQTASASRSYRSSSGKKQGEAAESTPSKAETFVDNMLKSASGSQFNPERAIQGSSVLTNQEKQEAQQYLKKVLAEGRMR